MTSSSNLPRYRTPPLNELVVGVQFETPESYKQVLIGEVRQLYRDEYPLAEEAAPLEATFELFGGSPFKSGPGLKLMTAPEHMRYWFLTQDGSELIQFQNDRMLHNWRVTEDHFIQYPHIESILQKFQSELSKLNNYFASLEVSSSLKILQYEITYINRIIVSEIGDVHPSKWFNIFNDDNFSPEFWQSAFSERVSTSVNQLARFKFDLKTALIPSGATVLVVSLTLKGAPIDHTVQSAIESLYAGRELLIKKFDSMLTIKAQNEWGRYVV